MPLDAADRETIERWSYPVPDDDSTEVDQLDRFGAPEVVALVRLQKLRGEMIATPGARAFAEDRFNHETNMGWLLDQIARLVAYLKSDEVDLNAAGEAVLIAEDTAQEYTTTIDMVVRNPRRDLARYPLTQSDYS